MIKKVLILGFYVVSLGLASCGDEKKEDQTTVSNLSWDADISSIIEKSCASTGGCHASGETQTNYVGNKNAFTQASSTIIDRLQKASSDALAMPPSTSGISLSSDDKQKIIDYLNQSEKN